MIIRPFITSKFSSYAGNTKKTQLSLAVRVVDESTVVEENPEETENIISGIQVYLKEDKEKKPILNLSGYYCFTDLNPGNYTLVVKTAESKLGYFFPIEVSLKIPLPNPLNPVQEIFLTPTPSYPFSAKATLIRGIVNNLAEYDLNLLSLDSPEALPEEGKNLVIVAKIGNFYHARIFDETGKQVIDQGKGKFLPNVMLVQELEAAFASPSIGNQTAMALIQMITLSLGYIHPVDDAEVKAGYDNEEKNITTFTDHNGEFVLLVKNIKFKKNNNKETDIIKNIAIEIKKDDEIILTSVEKILKEFQFKEGETANLKIIQFPEVTN